MNRISMIVIGVIIVIVVAGGSFYGGMVYGQSQGQAAGLPNGAGLAGGPPGGYSPGQGGPGAMPGQGQQGRGNGLVGEISEIGSGYIVVTDTNGTQTKVQVSDTTLIEKNASVKLADLAKGDTVMISGTQGSDGTLTARSVQVAPAGRMGGQTPVPTP